MVLYFTGTGNSKLAAEILAEDLNDEAVSLNRVLKEKEEWKFTSEKPFVLVSPIYAWRLPKIMETIMKTAEFTGSRRFYIVATMGSQSGRAEDYCEKILQKRGMDFGGFRGVQMPDNYVASNVMMTKSAALEKIRAAVPRIHEIAQIIAKRQKLCRDDHMKHERLMSGFINWGFNTFQVSSKDFTVSDGCIRCGLCVRECPMNNITLADNGKIQFGKDCIWCLGCIQKCPKQAIDYKGRTKKNGRYVCPDRKEIEG